MEKYALTDAHREYLRTRRKMQGYSAESVSEQLNHHKSWLGQIERGRLASIKKDDFEKLLSILLNIPLDKIKTDNCAEDTYFEILCSGQNEAQTDKPEDGCEFCGQSQIPLNDAVQKRFALVRVKYAPQLLVLEENKVITAFSVCYCPVCGRKL